MPDIRKSLAVLCEEWQDCTACDLGLRRAASGGSFVFGEGSPNGILFIGEGPGKTEEKEGRPFVGESGELLRSIIDKLKIASYSYITNIVGCRSCTPMTDEHGLPIVRGNGPLYKDEPPLPAYVTACRPRLEEEIYLVDPVVIVTLGGEAASALAGRPVAITKERGEPFHASIDGASVVPSLTDKKKQWARKVKGEVHMPVEPFQVRYLVVPTFHPAYVLRKLADRGPNNPMDKFVDDVRLAADIHERYLIETGARPYAP